MTRRPVVLVFSPTYLPGFKSGGPVQSVTNLVARLSDRYEFRIVTSDRDIGDKQRYRNVSQGWNAVGAAHVWYCARHERSPRPLARIAREVQPKIYYVNGFWYPPLSIQPLLLRAARIVPRRPLVLAPRGEFARGARALKQTKKAAYLTFARVSRAYDDVLWQATSATEEADIRSVWGGNAQVVMAGNIPSTAESVRARSKAKGSAAFVCLGRIDRMKNQTMLLEVARRLHGDVTLDFIGPTTDAHYEGECKRIATSIGDIRVRFLGELEPARVRERLGEYHAIVSPTQGENFGHAIFEGMSAGCIPIISDRTPWRDLTRRGIGWDLPLHDVDLWARTLRDVVEMGDDEWQRRSLEARQCAAAYDANASAVRQNDLMFQRAIEDGRCA